MSEFVDYPEDTEMRPLGEVLSDLYDRTRDFLGSLVAETGIVYQEQQTQEQSHNCGGASVCSRCAPENADKRGGSQVTKPGLRK